MEARFGRLFKEFAFVSLIGLVFFLLWGWLTSIDRVDWLQPALLALGVFFSIWGLIHAVLMEMVRHEFKRD